MAISKIILNGEVQMDVTSDTAAASNMLNGTTATKNDGTKVTGTIASKSSSDLTASGATVTAPAGYYSANASKSVTTMTLPTSTSTSATSGYTSKATLDRSTSDRYLNIPPGYNSAGGYYKINKVANGSVTAPSSISGTSATVSTGTNTLTLAKSVSVTPNVTTAGYISSGTAGNSSVSLTANVTTKGAATITPSTSEQSIAAGTYLTGKQTISAMPSGTAGTPTASKGSVSNNSISVTPSVTNTTGYITGGTKTGTAVTVSASELVSGTKSITENGTGVDVANYASVDVAVTSNVAPLTVTPSDEVQVFDGFEILKNLGSLSGTGSSSSSVKSITIPVDLSEIEYGETYHIVCDYAYVYQGGQFANTIKFDTDWVASENGSVPFEYIAHQGTTWDITSITLSKTALTVNFSANNGGLSFSTSEIFYSPAYREVPHDFVIKAKSEAQGYLPVTVLANNIKSLTVTPSSEEQTFYSDGNAIIALRTGDSASSVGAASTTLHFENDYSVVKENVPYEISGSLTVTRPSTSESCSIILDGISIRSSDSVMYGIAPFPFTYTGADLVKIVRFHGTGQIVIYLKSSMEAIATVTSDIIVKEVGNRTSQFNYVNGSGYINNNAIAIDSSGLSVGDTCSISGLVYASTGAQSGGEIYSESFDEHFTWDGNTHTFTIASAGTITVTPSSVSYSTLQTARVLHFSFDLSKYERLDGYNPVTVEPASSQLTYGTFTITANNTTTEANIGYLSMCSFTGSGYHPAYVATKVSGYSDIAYLGRWIINPSDGYMYVTFVGTNDTYTPVITATSGTATFVDSKLSGGTIEGKGHFGKSMRVYKISDGTVLTASYVNNN